jgi:curved DNA-binding protein CbpA
MSFKNYYIILGVKNTASSEEIKQAFRKLAKQYHPDKNHGNNSAEEFFKEIQEAYAVLSDQEKRKKYDLKFVYANNYQQIKNKSHTPYTGNAYQYAQQQAQTQREHRNRQPEQHQTKTVKEHKSGTDPYLFIISIVVAILLLLFIVFYSSK